MQRTFAWPARAAMATLLGLLAGCATAPHAGYDGALHPRAEDAVLSPVGGDLQRHFTVVIIALDGHALEAAAVDEARLAPGPHALRARVKYATFISGFRTTWMEAEVSVAFEAQRGHTYLPDAQLVANRVVGIVTDMGEGYPADCLPAARRGFQRLLVPREPDAACEVGR